MAFISRKDLNTIGAIAAGVGVLDFFLEGKLGAPVARAIKAGGKAAFTRGGPAAARFTGATALRAAGTVASVGKTIALRHPVLTAGAVVYYTYQNRDELGGLIEQGYELVQPAIQTLADLDAPIVGVRRPKKRMTAFNSAVKKRHVYSKRKHFLRQKRYY